MLPRLLAAAAAEEAAVLAVLGRVCEILLEEKMAFEMLPFTFHIPVHLLVLRASPSSVLTELFNVVIAKWLKR